MRRPEGLPHYRIRNVVRSTASLSIYTYYKYQPYPLCVFASRFFPNEVVPRLHSRPPLSSRFLPPTATFKGSHLEMPTFLGSHMIHIFFEYSEAATAASGLRTTQKCKK